MVQLFWDKTNDSKDTSLSLAFRLTASLAAQTQYIVHKLDSEQLILVSTLFDRLQFIFIQFVETLTYLADKNCKLQSLLPPNPEKILTLNYKLPPHYTFFIIRGSLKPLASLSLEEFH